MSKDSLVICAAWKGNNTLRAVYADGVAQDISMYPRCEIYLCPRACTNVENVRGERIEILLHCPHRSDAELRPAAR